MLFIKHQPKFCFTGILRWLNHLTIIKEGKSDVDTSLCNNQCRQLSLNSEADMLRGLLWSPIHKCSSSLLLQREAFTFIWSRPGLGNRHVVPGSWAADLLTHSPPSWAVAVAVGVEGAGWIAREVRTGHLAFSHTVLFYEMQELLNSYPPSTSHCRLHKAQHHNLECALNLAVMSAEVTWVSLSLSHTYTHCPLQFLEHSSRPSFQPGLCFS